MSAAEKLPQLVPLEVWAHDIYGTASPGLNTLRRWAREGKIQPSPKKHGRTYFVQANAEYVEPGDAGRLVRRLIGGTPKTRRE
jgi:hypothetical protein